MDNIKDYENHLSLVAKSGIVCKDCSDDVGLRLRKRMAALEVENRRNLIGLAGVVKTQKEEIEKLEYSLKLRNKLLQKIFKEYQDVLRGRRIDKIKIDSINRAFR